MDIYRVHVLCKGSLSLALTVIFVCCESFIDPSRFQYPRCWALSVTDATSLFFPTLSNHPRSWCASCISGSMLRRLLNCVERERPPKSDTLHPFTAMMGQLDPSNPSASAPHNVSVTTCPSTGCPVWKAGQRGICQNGTEQVVVSPMPDLSSRGVLTDLGASPLLVSRKK